MTDISIISEPWGIQRTNLTFSFPPGTNEWKVVFLASAAITIGMCLMSECLQRCLSLWRHYIVHVWPDRHYKEGERVSFVTNVHVVYKEGERASFVTNVHVVVTINFLSNSESLNSLYEYTIMNKQNFAFLCENKYGWNWSKWISDTSKLIRRNSIFRIWNHY